MPSPDPPGGDAPSNTVVAATPPDSRPAKARKGQRPMHCPAENSLYDLLYQHAGISLFVRPICWTDLHAKVLGAHFEELPAFDAPLPVNIAGSPPSKGHMRPSQTITTLSDALTEILLPATIHPVLSSNAVRTVMSILWPDTFSASRILPEMHMYFGDRVYIDAVRTQIMWTFPSDTPKSSYTSFNSVSTKPADSFDLPMVTDPSEHNPSGLPMMCYIGRNQLASIRKHLFRVAPGPANTWNEPVHRLQQMRAKSLIPENLDCDAHLVGIFLAMAQRHFYPHPHCPPNRREMRLPAKKGQPPPKFHDIKLRILTNDNETADFIVYTAVVTAKFLERFDDPFKLPKACRKGGQCPGIDIQYARVPIWPILGLRERLGQALGQDLVGPFDPEAIETWEEDPAETRGGKRKREVLSEVLNNSFEEESPGASARQSALPSKKQKSNFSKGAPLEVVV